MCPILRVSSPGETENTEERLLRLLLRFFTAEVILVHCYYLGRDVGVYDLCTHRDTETSASRTINQKQ